MHSLKNLMPSQTKNLMRNSMSKKAILLPALLLGLLVAGPASADVFVGAQVGKQYLDVRQTDGSGYVSDDTVSSNTSLGLAIGVGQMNGGSRISAELERYSISGAVDLDLFNFSYSYLFSLPSSLSLSRFSDNLKLRPFIGAELGYGWMDVDSQPLFNGGSDSGAQVGARAGLNLAITRRAEIEAGYRFSRVGLETTLTGKYRDIPSEQYDVRNNQGWWIGFNIAM
jgi:opacity protein-like surface antigen